jgi:hypothetical protein
MYLTATCSTSSVPLLAAGSTGSVTTENSGPDYKGNTDDATLVAPPIQAPPSPGTGTTVDRTA